MERALLQGERRAELDQVEAELEMINQIHLKLGEVEKNIQREKEKVNTYTQKGMVCIIELMHSFASRGILLSARRNTFSSIVSCIFFLIAVCESSLLTYF